MRSTVISGTVGALALLVVSLPARAQSNSDLEELKATIKAMQKTIADQNARIGTLERQLQQRPAQATAAPGATAGTKAPASGRTVTVVGQNLPVGELPANAVPAQTSLIRNRDNLNDLQQAAPRANNAPIDPSLKGFIPIPGTDTMFKIGGSARIDTIVDFANNGNPNLFTPSTIPVPGQPGSNGGERTAMETKGTRLSLELRRPVPWDSTLRIYTEYDFFGDSASNTMSFRVRHFYGQAWNLLIGQTFSAFMDPDAFPDVVDYQGPNGILNQRQPQIRYTLPIYKGKGKTKVQLFASIEQPDGEIDTGNEAFPSGSSVVNHVPDGVLGFRWEGIRGHLQGSGLFRELSFETDHGPRENVFGWGASLSGSLNIFENDELSAQATYGDGAARYVNDLGGENFDAAIENGRFKALPVFAGMAGYTHQWNEHWRSTISGGYVHLSAPESLGPFAIDKTIYASVNLMWHPTTSFRMGIEYLYGRKETIDRSERDAHRIDFVLRYDLVR
jgi:hypothetical protein